MNSKQIQDPIVIFGAPRSGTTYLNQIINSHPEIYVSHETRIFAWLHQSLNVISQREEFLMTARDRYVQHLRRAYPDLIREFYRTECPDRRYWGDKNPHYADPVNRGCLQTIAELFPGAKFVHIIRDGRDVVSSLVRKRHQNGEPWAGFDGAHWVWLNHVETGTVFGSSQSSDAYFELKYEDLIADDIGVTRQLFEFLNIELCAEVTEFCQKQQIQRTPFSGPTSDLSGHRGPSDWSQLFSREEQVQSLDLLGAKLVELAYETEASLTKLRSSITHA